TAIADWVGGFVFSPKVWLGVIVALVALLLFVVSGALRRRAPARRERQREAAGARQPSLAGQGAKTAAIDRPTARQAPARSKDGRGDDDDEFAEIEEILRRRGIS